MKTLYLCGAGNSEGVRLAAVVNSREQRWNRIILLDDDVTKHGSMKLDVSVIGSFSCLAEADDNSEVANLVTRTSVKRSAARNRVAQYGIPFATIIHHSVDTTGAELGRDIIIYQNATIGPESVVGEGSVVFMGAVVGHEAQVGEGCVIAANAVLNARVRLEPGVYVGATATLLPEVRVGAWATIGAGSVVIQDVPAGATAIGVPAQIVTPGTGQSNGLVDDAFSFGAPAEIGSRALTDAVGGIWQEVLHLPVIDVRQNFFETGGTSLSALQLCQRLQSLTHRSISLIDVFRYPTIESFVRHLQPQAAGNGLSPSCSRRAEIRREAALRMHGIVRPDAT